MALNDLIKEAYADPEIDDDIVHTVTLDHVAFDSPVYIVCNSETDLTLPLEPGKGSALFRACPVMIQLDGYDDDGPTSGRVQIDNVSKILVPYLEAAVSAGYPLTVTYRGYVMSDMSMPSETRSGLIITGVSLSASSATGTLEPASKADRMAFPRITYDIENYPALHGV